MFIRHTFYRSTVHYIGYFFKPQSWPRIFSETGFAGRASENPKMCDCCSFSPGEKVRMRAGKKN